MNWNKYFAPEIGSCPVACEHGYAGSRDYSAEIDEMENGGDLDSGDLGGWN